MEGDRERCLQAGMDDYLSKPFTQDQLVELLERWLPLEATIEFSAPEPKKDPFANESSSIVTKAQLDPGAIKRLERRQEEGQAGLVLKTIKLYLEKTPDLLDRMREAAVLEELNELGERALRMAKVSGRVGAVDLAALCEEVARSCADGNFGAVSTTLDILEYEYLGVRAALKDMLQRRAA
jgi:HPt (histidine-containing phosphotransfer) domain-containing protein